MFCWETVMNAGWTALQQSNGHARLAQWASQPYLELRQQLIKCVTTGDESAPRRKATTYVEYALHSGRRVRFRRRRGQLDFEVEAGALTDSGLQV